MSDHDDDEFDRILATLTSAGVRQLRIRRSGRLPHVGLGPPAGSMYGGPIQAEPERSPIRVQASVGEPLKELQDVGWHWEDESDGQPGSSAP